MSTPELRIAWAAGLFEGEGTISLRTSNRSRHGVIEKNVSIIMQLAMTDEDVVRKFHESVFGIGTVSGPFHNTRQATVSGVPRKPTWAWRTTKVDGCITVYSLLRPYLGIRRTATGDAALRGRWEYESESDHFNTRRHEFPEWITGGPVLDAG